MTRSSHLPRTALVAVVAICAACTTKGTASADSLAADTAATVAPAAGATVAPAATLESLASAGAADPLALAEVDRAAQAAAPVRPRQTRPAASSGAGDIPADTVRGIVSEVGSFPMTNVIVRPAGARAVRVTGPLVGEIARAAGAEVWVSGTVGTQGLEASAYAVRTVDGQRVNDGVLARDGDHLVLVTAGGRRVVAQPPAALQGMIGARVWLVGPLEGTISSYGVLRAP